MNEGHASLLAIELLEKEMNGNLDMLEASCDLVRSKCVFTTHTPVPAGHDKFSYGIARDILGDHPYLDVENLLISDGQLNMTYVALNLSGYVNGVAKRHGEVAKWQNAAYAIEAITNGVHVKRWVSPSFRELFDQCIPGWNEDNFSLRYACGINLDLIWQAHNEEKRRLIDFINHEENAGLCHDTFTIGFARRATGYKRADLLFHDTEKLIEITERAGKLQCIFAGKAHPKDFHGKEIIQKIFAVKEKLGDKICVVYLPNYDMGLAKLLVAGVDLWLNNPLRPLEASGTSGMKAALNGVPSLSVLDGWWVEGCIEGVTGWTIGKEGEIVEVNNDESDAASIYSQLENKILPLYYEKTKEYITVMRNAIAFNGSFFNTQRMMQQYVLDAYF
jgi:starch phosphorylase